MRRSRWIIFIPAISIVLSISICFWIFSHCSKPLVENRSESSSSKADQLVKVPTAPIKAVQIKKGVISEQIEAYGIIISAPGALQTISFPFECQINSIFVTEGQSVSQGDLLIEISPSPDTRLQMDEAKVAYEAEKKILEQVEKLFDLRLATNQELLQAKKACQTAQLQLQNLKEREITEKQKIRVTSQGEVGKIYTREGSIVAGGNPLLNIIIQKRLEARLGVETEDINCLQVNKPVSLTSVNRNSEKKVYGQIRVISHTVNSATRLVDVFVSLPQPDKFLLGEYVRGQITAASKEALVVPRSAVLPEDGSYSLFIVDDGYAVKHTVDIGLENHTEVEVINDKLKAGDLVVVLGNYELKNGMAVKVERFQ